jgi:hypothetical protein
MPNYRIHRLKDHLRRQFRYAPHVSGCAQVKPRDYDPGDAVEATSPYRAFFTLRDNRTPLDVGDVLESEDGSLRIFKFVGFEEAQWVVPESKSDPQAESVGSEAAALTEANPGAATETAAH